MEFTAEEWRQNKNVFNTDKLAARIEQLRENPYHHSIYIDDTTEVAAYCLARNNLKGDDCTIILCKQMRNRNDFESEIAFLSKCCLRSHF